MLIYKMIWKEKEISILGSLTYRYREIVCSLLSSRRHSWPFAEQGVFYILSDSVLRETHDATASMAPPLPYAASLIKNRLGRLG